MHIRNKDSSLIAILQVYIGYIVILRRFKGKVLEIAAE